MTVARSSRRTDLTSRLNSDVLETSGDTALQGRVVVIAATTSKDRVPSTLFVLLKIDAFARVPILLGTRMTHRHPATGTAWRVNLV